jgi:hypothetical protein
MRAQAAEATVYGRCGSRRDQRRLETVADLSEAAIQLRHLKQELTVYTSIACNEPPLPNLA